MSVVILFSWRRRGHSVKVLSRNVISYWYFYVNYITPHNLHASMCYAARFTLLIPFDHGNELKDTSHPSKTAGTVPNSFLLNLSVKRFVLSPSISVVLFGACIRGFTPNQTTKSKLDMMAWTSDAVPRTENTVTWTEQYVPVRKCATSYLVTGHLTGIFPQCAKTHVLRFEVQFLCPTFVSLEPEEI